MTAHGYGGDAMIGRAIATVAMGGALFPVILAVAARPYRIAMAGTPGLRAAVTRP